jgi:hypothetical protein
VHNLGGTVWCGPISCTGALEATAVSSRRVTSKPCGGTENSAFSQARAKVRSAPPRRFAPSFAPSASPLFQNGKPAPPRPKNPVISEGFAKSDRTSGTATLGQIRSLRPFRLIPSEPHRNWFGQKISHDFNGLKVTAVLRPRL